MGEVLGRGHGMIRVLTATWRGHDSRRDSGHDAARLLPEGDRDERESGGQRHGYSPRLKSCCHVSSNYSCELRASGFRRRASSYKLRASSVGSADPNRERRDAEIA
jgi:hypothetical protein